jgi:diguanylate cyclase (GGDEF)-like protein
MVDRTKPPQGATLASLEAFMASGRRRLTPELEAAFVRDRQRYQAANARAIVLRAMITYNMFLPADFLLLPKTAWLSVFLHLAVVTPYAIGVGFMMRYDLGLVLRDTLACVVPLLVVAQVMVIYYLNPGVVADQYQYFAVLVMVYTNINQPLELRFAAGVSGLMTALYLAVVLGGPAPPPVKLVGTVMMVAAGALSLIAKSRLEGRARHAFLRRLRDRLQREEAENEALRDALTGLSNRRHLDERTDAIWRTERDRLRSAQLTGRNRESPSDQDLEDDRIPGGHPAEPAGLQIAMVMLDIDHFKLFNDRYGHPAGDRCLKRVAGAMAAVLRGADDLAVRLGGEEFLLLLPDTGLEVAIQIAERVRRAIEMLAIPHEGSVTAPVVTASLGVTVGTVAADDPAALLAGADKALYNAKRGGRNQVSPAFITLGAQRAVWRSAG